MSLPMRAGVNRLEDDPTHAAKARLPLEGQLPPIPVMEAKREEARGIIDIARGHLYHVIPMNVTNRLEPDLVITGMYRPLNVGDPGNGTGIRRAMTAETETIATETRIADARSGEAPIAGIPKVDLPTLKADLTGNPTERARVIDIPSNGIPTGSESEASVDLTDTEMKDRNDTERGTGLSNGKPTKRALEKPLSDGLTIEGSARGIPERMMPTDLADRWLDPKQESRKDLAENGRKGPGTRAGIPRIHLRRKDQLIE